MSMMDTVRDAVELVQKLDNIDLLRQLLKVQQEAMALFEENLALKQQLRERDEQERLGADLVFRDDAYWRGDDATRAYCTRCWDVERKVVTLRSSPRTHTCPNCNKWWGRPSAPPVEPVQVTRARPRFPDW